MAKKHNVDNILNAVTVLEEIRNKELQKDDFNEVLLEIENFDDYNEYVCEVIDGGDENYFNNNKNYLLNNKFAIKLQTSMIDYVYPRLHQLMIDFDFYNLETNDCDLKNISNNFSFLNKNGKLSLLFYNTEINITNTNSCPIFNNPNINPLRTGLNTLYYELNSYIKFCNVVMDILKFLEIRESEIKKTINRAENIFLRIDSIVMIEKYNNESK